MLSGRSGGRKNLIRTRGVIIGGARVNLGTGRTCGGQDKSDVRVGRVKVGAGSKREEGGSLIFRKVENGGQQG